MTPREQARFDQLVAEVIDNIPPAVRELIERVPVIVIDHPTDAMLRDLGVPKDRWPQERTELCGLHTGVSNTERSVETSGDAPPEIHLFREGIVEEAGGWADDGQEEEVYEQIWVTLLHEIGHQFGLDEDDLQRLGYD